MSVQKLIKDFRTELLSGTHHISAGDIASIGVMGVSLLLFADQLGMAHHFGMTWQNFIGTLHSMCTNAQPDISNIPFVNEIWNTLTGINPLSAAATGAGISISGAAFSRYFSENLARQISNQRDIPPKVREAIVKVIEAVPDGSNILAAIFAMPAIMHGVGTNWAGHMFKTQADILMGANPQAIKDAAGIMAKFGETAFGNARNAAFLRQFVDAVGMDSPASDLVSGLISPLIVILQHPQCIIGAASGAIMQASKSFSKNSRAVRALEEEAAPPEIEVTP